MTHAVIVVLLFAAFVLARVFRSTSMWWKLVFAMMAGLLVGILSKDIAFDNQTDDSTELVSTVNNSNFLDSMQSLVGTVTEGTTICQTGVAGNLAKKQKLFDALAIIDTFTRTRDQPEYINDS